MRIRSGEVAFLGCGFNKKKYAGAAKICNENGLDYSIYRLGAKHIKRLLKKSYSVDINIEGRNLIDITREAQEIVYQ